MQDASVGAREEADGKVSSHRSRQCLGKSCVEPETVPALGLQQFCCRE